MKKTLCFALLHLGLTLACHTAFSQVQAQASLQQKWTLKDNWKMQSAVTDTSGGASISTEAFDSKGW